ncbi:Glycine-rich RNA-binding protein 2 [Phytophthora nicotianae]|uniref:Glycine-rich RNA-binding protein 2 n=1 Tax=Phytophthora nicotianae TaxID=4792 RepID=A0A0W8CR24_PHYNI|nr:Glycine-rich RNA-binding protein 2 [Phytophthora nicotianae]
MSTATSQTYRLNGWYPCSNYTFSDSRSSDGLDAECATFAAPLCYPGICETPEFATPTITIFVKRIPATNGDPKNASNVWMLEGGPELASTSSDLSRLDKSCVNARASFNWTANEFRVLKYLGTNDAYDGKYLLSQHSNEGIGSGESGSQ